MPSFCKSLLLVVTLPVATRAQQPCVAAMRELALVTPRTELHRLRERDVSSDVVAAGDACVLDSLGHRSTSRASASMSRFRIQSPSVRLLFQGGAPEAREQAGAWNGRGANVVARGGVAFDRGRLHVVIAPEIWYSQNKSFDFLAGLDTSRSGFASPFYVGPYSADLPTRLGTTATATVAPGETAAWASFNAFEAGLSTSAQQWGPGLRGGLQIGADAPGVPRVFFRTAGPRATDYGAWTFSAFYGMLSESRYFDRTASDDRRSLGAGLLAWSPSDSSIFTLGISHAELRSHGGAPAAMDQLNTLFARVRSPDAGMRAWVELGRSGRLPSVGRFAAVPYQGIAYQLGVQRAASYRRGVFLLSAEAANLEQPSDVRGEPTQDLYTSADIPQGWTQRGQVLGYATGPGSQSVHLSGDWIAARWSLGLLADRVRWNEDALFREYLPYPNRHDVSLSVGIRGAMMLAGQELALQASTGKRINYQFQNATYIPGYRTVDVAIPQLSFTITPSAFKQ